jgi:hypothetical protein
MENMDEVALEFIYSDHVQKDHRSNDGTTALLIACDQELSAVVRALVQTGHARPEWVWPHRDTTALLLCCQNRMQEEALLLIHTGRSNPTYTQKNGDSAIHIAAQKGLTDVIQALIDTGIVPLWVANRNGQTPFLLACQYGHEAVALLLLQTGDICPSYMDNRGRTAVDYARLSHLDSIVSLLRSSTELQSYQSFHGPDFISNDGTKYWGSPHRWHRDNDRPAILRPNGVREWYVHGQRHRIGAPAVIVEGGESRWMNADQPLPTLTPDQFPSHPRKETDPRHLCVLYLGHARLVTKSTAHKIPTIVRKETPLKLHICSTVAPTEDCVWPIHQFDAFRQYMETHSNPSSDSFFSSVTKVNSYFEKLVMDAQKEVIGHVYGPEWLSWANTTTSFPGQQLKWNKSHHYAEKKYTLTEEVDGQTGWFVLANNIGLKPGSKLLLPGPHIMTEDLLRWVERAGVTHFHLLDVSCSSVYYPESPDTELPETEEWIRRHLNYHTYKINRSKSNSSSSTSSTSTSTSAANTVGSKLTHRRNSSYIR